ncbi:Serine-protein kinase RsbW [Anatilimnocola aggregata]|uniref:Serine-protein kinase RsbW n=1 Tax=Anatilimnocola aggregata TaxID=2528021 RepID=A0A517YLE9_9BACT|nr:ATP-binding protein [Anatilimnocola aggregata]QDU31049.1 Serine-protein kinase RsbW [Anatilimnocola aggregata]
MPQSDWNWKLERRFPSDTTPGQDAIAMVLAQLDEAGWPSKDVYGIHLALEEALVNAIRHGNRSDPLKEVDLRCYLTDNRLRVEIKDEGPGFDPSKLPDPTSDEYLDRPNGRGVLLIRTFMSRVNYLGRGNVVVMEKDRSASSA